jgi:hypothetical protein
MSDFHHKRSNVIAALVDQPGPLFNLLDFTKGLHRVLDADTAEFDVYPYEGSLMRFASSGGTLRALVTPQHLGLGLVSELLEIADSVDIIIDVCRNTRHSEFLEDSARRDAVMSRLLLVGSKTESLLGHYAAAAN